MFQGTDVLYVAWGMLLVFGFGLLWIARRGDRLDRERKHPHPPTR